MKDKTRVPFTDDLLEQGASHDGSWSFQQLRLLGVKEIKKGWKNGIKVKNIPPQNINEFLKLKNKYPTIKAYFERKKKLR